MNYRKIFVVYIGIWLSFATIVGVINIQYTDLSPEKQNKANDIESSSEEKLNMKTIKPSVNIVSQIDPNGKVFITESKTSQNCYINRELSSLNQQPDIYMPYYFLSRALMTFENITAINYTRLIESDPNEVIFASPLSETYIYQKFRIEVSQFVNNVSIYIQDIFQGYPSNPVYTDENSWEVAIVNCSDDVNHTPDDNGLLGKLKKNHPNDIPAHWEVFDFENDGEGPIFLNISQTASIIENNMNKYWFAIRIKIPRDDSDIDGGPKFLYFDPDEGMTDEEGDIFKYGVFNFANFTKNDVVENNTIVGNYLEGDIDAFPDIDQNRYIVESDTSYNLTLETKFELNNLTKAKKNKNDPFTYADLLWLIYNVAFFRELWYLAHFYFIYSINFSIVTNLTDSDIIKNSTLYAFSRTQNKWLNLSQVIDIKLNTENEIQQTYEIKNPDEKLIFLELLNTPGTLFSGPDKTNPNNSIAFRFEYNGTNNYNVSINQFKIDIGELDSINKTFPEEPVILDTYNANNVTVSHGEIITPEEDKLETLALNDDNYFEAQAESDNITIEFELNILNQLDSSQWDMDIYDWIFLSPNPLITQMEIIINSNVSIQDRNDITLATLEIYKGNQTSIYLTPEQNKQEWFRLGDTNRSYANSVETRNITIYDASFIYVFLNFLNESDNNHIRLRLRFETNNTLDNRFNVTIDEFTINFFIKTPSDIAIKMNLGLDSNVLKPEDIQMKNFGAPITDIDNQTGFWEAYMENFDSVDGRFTFNITSLWYAIEFDVRGLYTFYKLEIDIDFEEKLNIQYMKGTNYFSVEVLDSLGDPIEGLELSFELIDADGKVIDEDVAITNEDGIAKGSLEFEEVGNGYKIQVNYDKVGIFANEDIKSDEFRIVDDFTLFMDILLIWLPYILIGLAALFTFVAVRHHKMTKLRRIWASDALILDDLLKITYIMIIHKEAGVTIYNKQISMELDSDLIGGFLTAISQFRSELKKDVAPKPGEKGFEMDYYDFKIVITDGDFARVALILDGVPSAGLKENQWQFTRKFEAKFTSELQQFKGDIKPFRETDELVDRMFDIKLMYPFQLAKHWEFTKLNKLEKALIEVAEQMQKERKFVFISSLLSYGLAGRKASRDQIISTILKLKKRGILVPTSLA